LERLLPLLILLLPLLLLLLPLLILLLPLLLLMLWRLHGNGVGCGSRHLKRGTCAPVVGIASARPLRRRSV
jgi:hypothetical protein